jgi:hypothetical protein
MRPRVWDGFEVRAFDLKGIIQRDRGIDRAICVSLPTTEITCALARRGASGRTSPIKAVQPELECGGFPGMLVTPKPAKAKVRVVHAERLFVSEHLRLPLPKTLLTSGKTRSLDSLALNAISHSDEITLRLSMASEISK